MLNDVLKRLYSYRILAHIVIHGACVIKLQIYDFLWKHKGFIFFFFSLPCPHRATTVPLPPQSPRQKNAANVRYFRRRYEPNTIYINFLSKTIPVILCYPIEE